MSAVQIPQCRVEILRGSTLFDDHFQKGWTTLGSDGETLTLTVGGAQTSDRTVSFDTSVFKRAIVRVTALDNGAYIKGYLDGAEKFSLALSLGINDKDLYSAYSGPIDTIQLGASGNPGDIATFDYITICKKTLLTPVDAGDVVNQLTITRPLLSKGISGAKLTIPNFNDEYTSAINKFDNIIIWLWRKGETFNAIDHKVFGGKIINPIDRAVQGPEYYIDLECHGYGYELNVPPALLQKLYSGTNGKTIIEDALALCSYLAKHPTKFFNCHTNCGISSTHDCECDEVKPMTPIREIMEKAVNPVGAKGFDGYITPAGCMIAHARKSVDHKSPISTITPESYEKGKDVHRIRNKIKVYGAAEKKFPTDGDSRTEQNNSETPADDGWVSDGSLSWYTGAVGLWGVGNETLRSTKSSTTSIYLRNSFSAISCFPEEYQKHNFFMRVICPLAATEIDFEVHLYAPDSSNYFKRVFEGPPSDFEKIIERNLSLGPKIEMDDPAQGWTKIGSPDWKNIQAVHLYLVANASGNFTVDIDGFHFSGARFRGSAEDSTSQGKYDVRCREPETDDALLSDVECTARAESLLEFLKNPVITLTDVLVDGDYRFTPGDRQPIKGITAIFGQFKFGQREFGGDFRILQFQYVVTGVNWDSILTLSDEPVLIDYVFKLLKVTQELLEKKR